MDNTALFSNAVEQQGVLPRACGHSQKEAHLAKGMSRRRKYSPEFKREAIAVTRQPSLSCRQIALEVGINPNLLSRRRREADEEIDKAFKGSGSHRDEGVSRFKGELASVRKDLDLLREAAVFLAKESS